MKFNASLQWIRLNLVAYRRDLIAHLVKSNERAGQLWLESFIDKIPIPTWSGASRATFQKLASELGTSVPIGQTRSAKDRTALGRATAFGSGVVIDQQNLYVGFRYKSSLRYLAYNEFNAATTIGPPPMPSMRPIPNTPYRFTERGAQAWLRFAKTVKLPSPYKLKYLKRFKVS